MKFFNKDEAGYRTFIEWKNGYVKLSNDWQQFFNFKSWNWINFRFFSFEVELDRLCGEHISIDLCILGFGIYIQQFIKQNEKGKKLLKQVKEIETIEKSHQTQVNKLKAKIRSLRSENRKLKKT